MGVFGQSEVVPIRTQRVPQTIETRVTFVPVPGAYVRYAYARSSDSMASQIEGQDYLCFQHNDQRLAFVICDGVGSSFCGNLAARILGDGLLDWLWSLDIAYLGGADALKEAAASFLQRLQKQAQHEVEEYEIPEQIPPLIRQALEQQRTYGSEAIFAAARIDHPGPMIPDGLLSLFWMGDTQVRVSGEDGGRIDIGGAWENANRWSTTQGVRGEMSAWMHSLKGIGRVAAFTDGLTAHAGGLLDYSDDRLDREIHAGALLPNSDDVAFVDVVVRSPQYEGYPDLPDPNAERPHLDQIWNPTGADTYELRWSWPGSPRASFIVQEATNPALSSSRAIDVPAGVLSWRPAGPQEPGHYYYRVRAVNRRGTVTPWSDLRKTKVAHPPPPAPELQPVEAEAAPVLSWSGEGEVLAYRLEQSADADFGQPEVVYEGPGSSWAVPVGSYRPGTYYYRVCAVSDGGASPWSEMQQVETTLPPPPTPHLATASYGQVRGAYELRWQPVHGATKYELEETERESDEAQVITLEDSIYQVTDQEVGEYVYRVRACHDFGCSEWSNEQLVIVTPERPSEAPVLTVEGPDTDNTIHLTWTEVESATEYVVAVGEDSDFRRAHVLTPTGCALDLPRREPGVLYFRVSGANVGGQGPWSASEKVAIVPRAPGWIEATLSVDEKRIVLSWGTAGGHVTYCLEMVTGTGETTTASEVYRGPDTQFEIEPPGGVDAVSFRVRADLSGVQSQWQESDRIPLHPPPTTPVLEKPEINERSEVRLRWEGVAEATHYVIEVSRDKNFADVLSAIPTDEPVVKFHPPGSGRYWFRVKACHRTRQSAPSNRVAIQVARPAPPHLWPVDPVRENSPYEITWKGMPGCSYYEAQESASSTFEPGETEMVRIQHPGQKLERAGRAKGRYYYRVKAFDEQFRASLWSDVLVVEVV